MIEKSSKVTFHYVLTVDGEEVDSSTGKDPLAYVHGEGNIIPGLEKELEGLNVGDKKAVVVSPQDGYGELDEDSIQEFPKDSFNEPNTLEVGMTVTGEDEDGNPFHAEVASLTETDVTLDFNHPLAGQTLHFDVEIVSIA